MFSSNFPFKEALRHRRFRKYVPNIYLPDEGMLSNIRVLRFHKIEDDEDGGAVIDEWKGSLLRIGVAGDESTYEVVGPYENARQLARLLGENGVFL